MLGGSSTAWTSTKESPKPGALLILAPVRNQELNSKSQLQGSREPLPGTSETDRVWVPLSLMGDLPLRIKGALPVPLKKKK